MLYRNAANVLKTPDTLDAGALRIAGSAIAFSNLSGAASTTQIPSLAASKVTSGRFDVDRLAWTGSQTAYDALTKDANTIYLITS